MICAFQPIKTHQEGCRQNYGYKGGFVTIHCEEQNIPGFGQNILNHFKYFFFFQTKSDVYQLPLIDSFIKGTNLLIIVYSLNLGSRKSVSTAMKPYTQC